MTARRFRFLLALGLMAPPLYAADAPAPDVAAQFENVLAAMKHPPASGVLVTEIMADSAAGAAGLQAGDVITRYYGTPVRDLATLRQQVADAIAHRLEETGPPRPGVVGSSDRVLLVARRGDTPVNIQVARQPLGIRAIEVEAGVPAPRNPPASPRGSVTLAWRDLRAPDEPAFYRISESPDGPGASGETWLGWRKVTLTAEASDLLALSIDSYVTDPADGGGKITQHDTTSLRLRVGDYAATPAFILDSLEVSHRPDRGEPPMTGRRLGEMLRLEPKPPDTPLPANRSPAYVPPARDQTCPLTALPLEAVPLLAAAMPQVADAAVALHLLSLRDYVARPGYLVVTRGRQPLPSDVAGQPPAAANPQAWRVDLLHCGVIVESYWLSEQRRLILVDTMGPSPIRARRVSTESAASAAVEEKPPASQPK